MRERMWRGARRIGHVLLPLGMAFALFAAPAAGTELDDLKAQIKALQERLQDIENRQQKMRALESKIANEKAVATGDFPGSWKMPGSNTSVSFSGYVKLDAIYDLDYDAGPDFFVGGNPSGIPLDGTEDVRSFSMHARQTRLRFDSLTPTPIGTLKTRIETDFFGSGRDNSAGLRMRHAYATLGPVLAGQAWTILQDEDTYADTVDFYGPVGMIFARQPQLRYTWSMGQGLTAQVALDDPSSPRILHGVRDIAPGNDEVLGTSDDEELDTFSPGVTGSQDRLPNLLGALRWRPSWGAVNLAGVVGQIRDEDNDDDLTTYGVHVGAHVNVLSGTQLMATFNAGKGAMGFYMQGAGIAATRDIHGNLDAVDSMGGFFGIRHRWTDTLTSNVYYGWVENDFDDSAKETFAGEHSESLRTLHANLWWDPAPKVRAGIEFIRGSRDTNDDQDGDATRLQLGLQYSF